jgi:beta-lactamase regulating signal transducer with metallopeptidase domain/protocatechuate 3,4-dioxygenase beta subunit
MIVNALLENLGFALFHSLWIGGAIGLLAAMLNASARRIDARIRYAGNLSGLAALAIAFPVVLIARTDIRTDAPSAYANSGIENTVRLPVSPIPAFREGETDLLEPRSPMASWDPIPPEPAENVSASNPQADVGSSKNRIGLRETVAAFTGKIYVVGLLIFIGRLMMSVGAGRRIRRCCLTADATLNDKFESLARDLGVRLSSSLAVCHRVTVPMAIGVLRPVVVLPISIVNGLHPEQMQAILLHELAHLRRYDHWVLVLQRTVEAMLFFHPVAWYLSRRISADRERCCDDMVLRMGVKRECYAAALYEVAEAAVGTPAMFASAANGSRPSELRCRIRRILGEPEQGHATTGFAGVLAVALTCCFLASVSTSLLHAKTLPKQKLVEAKFIERETSQPVDASPPPEAARQLPVNPQPVVPQASTPAIVEQPVTQTSTTEDPTPKAAANTTSLELQSNTLQECLDKFAKAYGVLPLLPDQLRKRFSGDEAKRVSASITDVSEEAALAIILDQFDLKSESRNKQIIVSARNKPAITKPAQAVQVKRVRATVIGSDGQPVNNAIVAISLHIPYPGSWPLGQFRNRSKTVADGRTNQLGQFDFPEPEAASAYQHLLWIYSEKHELLVQPLYDSKARVLLHPDWNTTIKLSGEQQTRSHQIVEGLFNDDYGPKPSYVGSQVQPLSVGLIDLQTDHAKLVTKARNSRRFGLGNKKPIEDMSRTEILERFKSLDRIEPRLLNVAAMPAIISEQLAATADTKEEVTFRTRLPVMSSKVRTPDGVWQVAEVSKAIKVRRRAKVTGFLRGYAMMPPDSLSMKVGDNPVPIKPDGSFEFLQARGTVQPNFYVADGVPFFVRTQGLLLSRPHQQNRVQYDVLRAATVKGSLVTPDGKAVAGAEVHVSARADGGIKFHGSKNPTRAVETDEAGRFETLVPPTRLQSIRVGKLPTDLETFFGYDAKGTIRYFNQRRNLSPGEVYEHRLQLVESHVIEGQIVDTENRPVGNANLRCSRSASSWLPETTTDHEGRFKLRVSDYWLHKTTMDTPTGHAMSLKTHLYVTTDDLTSMPVAIESRNPWLGRIPIPQSNKGKGKEVRRLLSTGVAPRVFVNETVNKILRTISYSIRTDRDSLKKRGIDLEHLRISISLPQTTVQEALEQILPRCGLMWVERKPQHILKWADGISQPVESELVIIPRDLPLQN